MALQKLAREILRQNQDEATNENKNQALLKFQIQRNSSFLVMTIT
jgi:hypothetical protein